MSDETAPVETWAAEAETLYRDGIAVGTLISADFAEWVAEACETLAEMDKAQAEWEASGEAAHCSMVDIGGEQMRMQGGADMPEPLRDAMADVVGAARRAMAEAKAAERAEIEREVRAQCAAELEAAEDLAARQRKDHRAEIAEAEAQVRAANAEIERLREELTSVLLQRADYQRTLKRVGDESAVLSARLTARDHALRFVKEHAEVVNAALARVKALAITWAALAPGEDWADNVTDTIAADCGRAVLAALAQSGEEK